MPNAFEKRTGESVLEILRGFNLLDEYGVSQSHRMPAYDPGQRFFRQVIGRLRASQLGMQLGKVDSKRIPAQELVEREPIGATHRVNDRAFHERHAKMGQQRRETAPLPPLHLSLVHLEPQIEQGGSLPPRADVRRVHNHLDHFVNLFARIFFSILGEPLGRQAIAGPSLRDPRPRVNGDS